MVAVSRIQCKCELNIHLRKCKKCGVCLSCFQQRLQLETRYEWTSGHLSDSPRPIKRTWNRKQQWDVNGSTTPQSSNVMSRDLMALCGFFITIKDTTCGIAMRCTLYNTLSDIIIPHPGTTFHWLSGVGFSMGFHLHLFIASRPSFSLACHAQSAYSLMREAGASIPPMPMTQYAYSPHISSNVCIFSPPITATIIHFLPVVFPQNLRFRT